MNSEESALNGENSPDLFLGNLKLGIRNFIDIDQNKGYGSSRHNLYILPSVV